MREAHDVFVGLAIGLGVGWVAFLMVAVLVILGAGEGVLYAR